MTGIDIRWKNYWYWLLCLKDSLKGEVKGEGEVEVEVKVEWRVLSGKRISCMINFIKTLNPKP